MSKKEPIPGRTGGVTQPRRNVAADSSHAFMDPRACRYGASAVAERE